MASPSQHVLHELQGDTQAQISSLRDEGNTFFGKKDYAKALDSYDKALKLTTATHQDKPLLHANKAACHMMAKKYASQCLKIPYRVLADFTASIAQLFTATHVPTVGTRKPPMSAQLLLRYRLVTTKL